MPDKSLGQHWLHDRLILEAIADCADISGDDTVLEIGSGLGTLTSVLLSRAKNVVALEFDSELARKLPAQFPGKNLEVIESDILSFDFSRLPAGYKVVANVPYYITAKIVQTLTYAPNPPDLSVLLIQKEVAERLAAQPGEMSILAISAQLRHEVSLGPVVTADHFTPPPKVDSQVVVLRRRAEPLFPGLDEKAFFRIIHAGFSEKRKKLRSSLAGGLAVTVTEAETMLAAAGIDPNLRAQALSLANWHDLATMKV
jgi:16S rRNA (adenine1518-N6/adenine1519-N6)-dimethyltransferase